MERIAGIIIFIFAICGISFCYYKATTPDDTTSPNTIIVDESSHELEYADYDEEDIS